MIDDPDISMLPENAGAKNPFNQLEKVPTDIGESLEYIGDLEPIGDFYFSDDPDAFMLPANADDKSPSINLRENNSKVVDVHTQTVVEQKPLDQLEQMPTDIEEVLKCIGELAQIYRLYLSDNMDKELASQQQMLAESAVQQVPGFQSLGNNDPAEVAVPTELLSLILLSIIPVFRLSFQPLQKMSAPDVAHWSSWSTGNDLLVMTNHLLFLR